MAGTQPKDQALFEESPFDPVQAATGRQPVKTTRGRSGGNAAEEKRKAGYYLPASVLDRFNRKFYELKLQGRSIENKSALLAAALRFILDDIDRGSESRFLKGLP